MNEIENVIASQAEGQTTTEATSKVEEQATTEVTYPDSTKRAIQNTLKVMEGRCGGGFYVKYIMDEGTCYGWLNLVIVYPDGSYKSIILYKNCFKEADTESGNGVYHQSEAERKAYKKGYPMFNPWDGPAELNNFTSMAMYETPQMPIPAITIWKRIIEHYHLIPIVKVNQTSSLEQLLDELQACAEEKSKEYGQGFMNDNDRFYIATEEFRNIVEANGWVVSQARVQMDMQGLFDKDSGTRGYQKSKRVGGEVKRFYVVKKNPTPAIVVPRTLPDVKFDRGYKTSTEKNIERLNKENKELVDKYNGLVQKYDPEEKEESYLI